MFDPSPQPRVFAMPSGADFGTALVDGLQAKLSGLSPTEIAKVEIYVNTSRMARRIKEVFDKQPPSLLPRIRLVTDLARDPLTDAGPAASSPLRRRLELSQFVAHLLTQEPDLAPRAALFDLSDSLARLMEEMHGEGVDPTIFDTLDVSDESGHWDRALRFLKIVAPFFDESAVPDKELRLRRVITSKIADWAIAPPQHPIIVAGSTGSRGATGLFMQAVATLPQGAVILPGFDFDLPDDVWREMDDPLKFEDHPQYRFQRLLSALGVTKNQVAPWDKRDAPHAKRNALISLSLRPAPVTDQWLRDGPDLGDLHAATEGLTLVEAPSPRAEAEVIALRLRQAADDGITAALITPDRMLTRQVAAALDRWDIKPDDSAGIPLPFSPPGRFLRQVADMATQPLTGEALLSLLKHPLCSSSVDRNVHLLQTRELELHLRRFGPAFPTSADLTDWANGFIRGKKRDQFVVNQDRLDWVAWLAPLVGQTKEDDLPLAEHLSSHLALAEALAAGPIGTGSGGLWEERAGREATKVVDNLNAHADAGGVISAGEYASVFASVLNDGTVRDPEAGHPNILIWGTLEARVQSADLVILGGMNEGIWPEAATPDPWLNRSMRKAAGLLLPERKIGLSAHDYQQAVANSEVWITRAKRDTEAETVPSRWVNRLVNLLGGLPKQNGPSALKAMRAEGGRWLSMAETLSQPAVKLNPAKRPSPRPPVSARPDEISVTEVKTLIRDPYAIYAKRVLGLDPLDPLVPTADAPLRGTIIHAVLEEFIRFETRADAPDARDILMQMTRDKMDVLCPWPTIRAQWIARVDKGVDQFLASEIARQLRGTPVVIEGYTKHPIGQTGVTLVCKTDRIDMTKDGSAQVFDYKTGAVPSKAVQNSFDKQLLLTSALVELGAFDDLGTPPVTHAEFVAFNTDMRSVPAPLADTPVREVWENFQDLIAKYNQPDRGYSARIAMQMRSDAGYYDHLSRFGEWDTSDTATPEDLR